MYNKTNILIVFIFFIISLVITGLFFEMVLRMTMFDIDTTKTNNHSINKKTNNQHLVVKEQKTKIKKRQTVCNSFYYAIIERSKDTACVKSDSPALLGPPQKIIEHKQFIQNELISDNSLCDCLKLQKAYKNPYIPVERMDEVIINETLYPIKKWVCGDRCIKKDNY